MKNDFLIKIRRICAMAGVILIVLLYLATLITAFIDKTQSHSLLMASLFATFFVAFVLYAMSLITKVLKKDSRKDDQ